METNETPRPFRSYAVRHNDGTRGRVMGIIGEYTKVSFRDEQGHDTIEIRSTLLTSQWHRDYTVR